MKRVILGVSIFLICIHGQLFAQNEVLREMNSLAGLAELGIVVNIETPSFISTEQLNPGVVREGILAELSDTHLRILDDSILRQSDEFPILHVHVNVMRASNGTYPFAIEMNVYQPVKLVLKGDLQSMASTWNKGQIGIVSEDQIPVIAEEAIYAIHAFKEEFTRVN